MVVIVVGMLLLLLLWAWAELVACWRCLAAPRMCGVLSVVMLEHKHSCLLLARDKFSVSLWLFLVLVGGLASTELSEHDMAGFCV